MTTDWQTRLADLLAGNHSSTGDPVDAGAQLVVTDPGGTEVFRQALARHFRAEPEPDQVIWIRPLVGGQDSSDLGFVFNLNQTRRHALAWTEAHLDANGDVIMQLRSGETARIQPAEGDELAKLERWDDFLNRLTREEEQQLAALEDDSWHGQFS
ncbi:hypothetical protein OOK44_36255 [Streptomyces cellulosae]|uniref:Uncharacterized protein n=1 Tax=Streptomyces althioticus TaxID=83380 RepID=A0ABZ1YFT1_9ACTN|nr:hypothetical protein [Streptomyces cellulosae]WTB93457.1 hypothetical protein OIE99_35005 [Streptomyces cellulosae]WTC60848.1 hypothetical protein OH715_36755 [Streptomyces cellulosae]